MKLSAIDGLLAIEIPEVNLSIQTTDLVHFHNGGFEILGRADDIINSGGLKINPTEIEPLLAETLSDLGIENNFYLGKKRHTKLGECAVLMLEGKSDFNSELLLNILKGKLPKNQAPLEIIFVPKFAFTDTGKVIRKRI